MIVLIMGKVFLYVVLLPMALLLLVSGVAAVRGALAAKRAEQKGRMPEHW